MFRVAVALRVEDESNAIERMELSMEDRQSFMRFYTQHKGRENDRHELFAEDVRRVLREAAGDAALSDGLFQQIGKGKSFWTKPQYLSAMQTVNQHVTAIEFGARLDDSLKSQLENIGTAHSHVKTAATHNQDQINILRKEVEELKASHSTFDALYVANHQKLQAIAALIFSIEREALARSSPRSESALDKLNLIADAVLSVEQQMFGLVPLIGRPDTKTRLSVLCGKCEEIQSKQVDAIQSMGLSSHAIISARRKSLAKRLDILITLGRTLHTIASDKVGGI